MLKLDDLEHNKKVWAEIYTESGLKELSRQVIEEEVTVRLAKKKTLMSKDVAWTAEILENCFLSADSCVLESIISGNLALDSKQDRILARVLDRLQIQSENQPGVYMQQLVDKGGYSPSANELLNMATVMESYVKGCRTRDTHRLGGVIDDDAANKIDNLHRSNAKQISSEKTKTGYRRHMCVAPRNTTDTNWHPNHSPAAATYFEQYSKTHLLETTNFIRNLRRRIQSIQPMDRDKPLKFPLCEAGYSVRCISRLKQHAYYSSSNYIMNLADAIFQISGASFPTQFGIQQFVVYLIWDSNQAEIAEIGFAKLAESYTINAGGFSYHVAGLSNHSASVVNAREWNAAKSFMLKRSPFCNNLESRIVDLEKQVIAMEHENKEMLEKSEQERLDIVKDALNQASRPTAPTPNAELACHMAALGSVRSQWDQVVERDANAVKDLMATVVDINEKFKHLSVIRYYAEQLRQDGIKPKTP